MLKGTTERVAFTVRLPQTLHKALRMWCAAHDSDLQDAVSAAVSRLVEPADGESLTESIHEAAPVLDFLKHGDPGQVELVKHALELHTRKQRASRKRSSA